MAHLKGSGICSCGMQLLQCGRRHLCCESQAVGSLLVAFGREDMFNLSHLRGAKENDPPCTRALLGV